MGLAVIFLKKSKRRLKISAYTWPVFEYKRIRLFLSVYSIQSIHQNFHNNPYFKKFIPLAINQIMCGNLCAEENISRNYDSHQIALVTRCERSSLYDYSLLPNFVYSHQY